MSADNRCRSCGSVLMAEDLGQLCPICLLRSGQAESDTGPFMSGTFTAAGALATLDKTLGGIPRVLLRDSELSEGPGPLGSARFA